jgi:hypothetical protein
MGYRFVKFVGRHRWGTVGTVAAATVLIGGLALSLRQSALERARTREALEALDEVCAGLPSSSATDVAALRAARQRCATTSTARDASR